MENCSDKTLYNTLKTNETEKRWLEMLNIRQPKERNKMALGDYN